MSWFGARPQMGVPMVPMPMMQMQMGMRMGGPPTSGGGAPPMQAQPRPQKMEIPTGPAVTVFVGNITERAPDAMVRHLLTTCGNVLSWKRVQGATGKLQAFGFCELSNPDAGLRAIRLLNDYAIADKSLVVKVDAKTKKILDDYLTDRMKKNGDEEKESEGYLDDDMKYDDNLAKERVLQILKDHAKEIESFVPQEGTALPVQREAPPAHALLQRMGTRDEGLDNVEDEKKGIISREIDKFRETMKIREAEREEKGKEKDKDREREKERDRDRKSSPPARRSRDRESREKSRGRESRGREARSQSTRISRRRSPSPPPRVRVSRSRSRSREPREPRSRGTRSEERNKSEKELQKEREMEAEEKERRKAEKKATEKEENYQARLMAWERRESKKAKDYEKEKKKEKQKAEDMEREAKKLKEFLEDYDDEKDDPKYYRGRELARRMSVREREAAKDADDRTREEEEVEELKKQIFSNASVKDPDAEFAKRLRERENQFLPPGAQQKQQQPREASPTQPLRDQSPPSPDREPSPMDDSYGGGFDNGDNSVDISSPTPDPEPTINPISLPGPKLDAVNKRRKMQVADIFNQDLDDDDDHKPKKKLKPLPPVITDKKKEKPAAVDDKKQHIKSLIEKIPTDKTALFEYTVDWDLVDNQLMEKRIRPWVNKKIAEYIGEPEPSLTDFICSKVLAGSQPKAILDDVQMVLDEEAEVFVVKMWRLLIYEIENKKQKATAPVK